MWLKWDPEASDGPTGETELGCVLGQGVFPWATWARLLLTARSGGCGQAGAHACGQALPASPLRTVAR